MPSYFRGFIVRRVQAEITQHFEHYSIVIFNPFFKHKLFFFLKVTRKNPLDYFGRAKKCIFQSSVLQLARDDAVLHGNFIFSKDKRETIYACLF